METSIFLAKAFGLYLVIFSISLIFNWRGMQRFVTDLIAHRGTMLLISVMTLILGILAVLSHNIWVWNWRVVVTLLCWLMLLQGVLRLYFPERIQKIALRFQRKNFFMITGFITLVIGLFLLYCGFGV